MKKTNVLALTYKVIFLLTIMSCGNDDDVSTPDYSEDLIGYWEFDTYQYGSYDGVYFDDNGFLYFYRETELGTKSLMSPSTYTIENNVVNCYLFGDQSIEYDGSHTIHFDDSHDFLGGSITKDPFYSSVYQLINPIELEGISVLQSDVTEYFPNGNLCNFDAYDDGQLLIPAGDSRTSYFKFSKTDLTYTEEITGIENFSSSISVHHTDPFWLINILSQDDFTIYQPNNPAFHPPAVPIIANNNQKYEVHAITNSSGYDQIAYNTDLQSFDYFDINDFNQLQSIEHFAFFNADDYSIRITGMDYLEGANKLIFSDSYNIHVFNIGFNGAGDGVNTFIHQKSFSILPEFTEDNRFWINGLHYDQESHNLYLLLKNYSSTRLLKTRLYL